MTRLFRWLDPMFGLALAASLLMVAVTAWPGAALAADRQVGPGEPATEARIVAEFDAVQTAGPRVVVRLGSANAVSVTAERKLLPLLETVIEDTQHGRTLVVRWKRWSTISSQVEPLVTVTAARLSALVVSGSGDVVYRGNAKRTKTVSGSGEVTRR
jgi:hypothetical protein